MPTAPATGEQRIQLNHLKPVPRPGTWVSAVVVLLLGAMFVHALVTNPKFHWSTVWFFFREVHVDPTADLPGNGDRHRPGGDDCDHATVD